ncbi:protein NODULATION SIGNALING PATHWAY 2-like [Impatiens glandulifera]|uniref:protein NODULATION SIGNALING PATHWAY 2-like n=1 Tax=Impatiens glandulifera TaxID=253017 RepID=UPI001FB05675|nr:protein NODULATION SIGNALING PATHWAY 2-like [Impatiens glandulifera]
MQPSSPFFNTNPNLFFNNYTTFLTNHPSDFNPLPMNHDNNHSSNMFNFSSNESIEIIQDSGTLLGNDNQIGPSLNWFFTFPIEGVEIDQYHELSMVQLAKAYGDAMKNEQLELSNVIMNRAKEKVVSPVGGTTMDRLLYYLFRPLMSTNGKNYLWLESMKNFHAAFKTFYQNFPYGKIAHLTANRTILETITHDLEVVHIVDFNVGSGIQWPTLLETIGYRTRHVKLTMIKWDDEYSDQDGGYWQWDLEETKILLKDHAKMFGLNLEVTIMNLNDLMIMIEGSSKVEWLVFNCMVGLPHMGKKAMNSNYKATGFLSVAKLLLARNEGIVIYGDIAACDDQTEDSLLFDKHITCYQSMLESIEWNFPLHLGEARTALECLFVAPLISSFSFKRELDRCNVGVKNGLEGWRISEDCVMESMEILSVCGGLYGLDIHGENCNEMRLRWKDVPLVTVSCWKLYKSTNSISKMSSLQQEKMGFS